MVIISSSFLQAVIVKINTSISSSENKRFIPIPLIYFLLIDYYTFLKDSIHFHHFYISVFVCMGTVPRAVKTPAEGGNRWGLHQLLQYLKDNFYFHFLPISNNC